MNVRSVLAHAILALGAMALAYLVWTDDGPSQDVDEVTVVECDADELDSVRLALGDEVTTLELTREDGLEGWVTVERAPEDGEARRERFVASDALEDVVEQLAPLRARRSLGELDEDQLASIGLDEPEGELTLTCGDRTETFALGGRAYGSGDRYARRGDTVYLLGSERLQPLESAELRLMERRLHAFEWPDLTALRIEAFGRRKRLLQRNRLDEASAQWVDAERPDTRNELFGNWLAAYPRMRVQRYLEGEPGSDLEQPDAPAPTPVMTLTFEGEDGELARLELARVDVRPPAYYARTETTRGWVRVPTSVAQAFEDDARPVLGLDPVDRPAPSEDEARPGDAAEPGGGAEAGAPEGQGADGADAAGSSAADSSTTGSTSASAAGGSSSAPEPDGPTSGSGEPGADQAGSGD